MESAKLYLEIENIIRKNLQYAYNKNTPKVYYNISNSFPDSQESIRLKNFSVILTHPVKNELKLSCWRIPQTRIYLSELSCLEYCISELQYFESSIVLIKNYSNHPFYFKLKPEQKQTIFTALDNEIVSEQITTEAFEQSTFYLTNSDKVIDLRKQINNFIDYERSINPINKIFSTDLDFLKTIDSLWADIPWISEKGKIILSLKDNNLLTKPINLLLSELSLYLGYNDEYQHPDSNPKGDSFYSLLTREKLLFASSTKEKIQQFWDLISLPVFKYKLIHLLKGNPTEIVSFLLLAIKNNFWWIKVAVNYIKEFIHVYLPEIESLFTLVFLLKYNFNITLFGNTTLFSNFSEGLLNNTNSLRTSKHSLKFVELKTETLSSVELENQRTISINKKARIKYDSDLQEVEIYPQTFQYNLISKNICTVIVDSLKLNIHLVWKDFAVSVEDLRLKFLFKKDRYQISIKGNKRIKSFTINAEAFSFEENRYYKTYYVPGKTEEIFNAYYFDNYGRTVNIYNQTTTDKVGIHTLVQNKYGHIINQIHSRKKLTSKNTIIDSLDISPGKIDTTSPVDLIIPKGGVVHLDPVIVDSVLSKLYYTDCSLLERQLCIYVSNKEFFSTIRKEFFNTFNFNVDINMLSKINLTFSTINIIVAEKYPAKLIKTFAYFDEVLLKENGQKCALFTSEKKIIEWLKNISTGWQ